jgi:hypothetical protein
MTKEATSAFKFVKIEIDKPKITSSFLADYALELTEPAPFNGLLSDTIL